jgi:hypothetical protein
MDISLLLLQTLNGLQFGVLLFLLAAGLTLVFGIMTGTVIAQSGLDNLCSSRGTITRTENSRVEALPSGSSTGV